MLERKLTSVVWRGQATGERELEQGSNIDLAVVQVLEVQQQQVTFVCRHHSYILCILISNVDRLQELEEFTFAIIII